MNGNASLLIQKQEYTPHHAEAIMVSRNAGPYKLATIFADGTIHMLCTEVHIAEFNTIQLVALNFWVFYNNVQTIKK